LLSPSLYKTHAALSQNAVVLLAQLIVPRVCRTLYAVMLSPEVPHTAKAPMFLALLFKVRLDCNAIAALQSRHAKHISGHGKTAHLRLVFEH